MTTIVTRAGKGSPLTNAELDQNFLNLNSAKLEAGDLSPYLLSATAAATYQTIAGMSSYLTAASASSTYLPLAGGTLTGNVNFQDTLFTLQDDVDATKKAQFQLSAITTATTRTYTLPNATGTLALLSLAQTFSGAQTFSSTVTMSNGTLTFGNSTANQNVYLANGATASTSTKTVEIATNGTAGSTTNLTIGSVNGTTVTANGSWSFPNGITGYDTSATAAAMYLAKAGGTMTGTLTVPGNLLAVVDVTDATKVANFSAANVPTATTNTYTLPAASTTLAGLTGTQTFTGSTTFSATTLTFGSSTATSTVNVGTGASISTATKTINIGTNGVASSTTNINIGSATAGANVNVTANGTWTFANPLSIASGGTNSTATPTAGGIGYGTGTAHAYTAAGTSGQALISAGASAPAFGTLGVAGGGTGATTAAGAVSNLFGGYAYSGTGPTSGQAFVALSGTVIGWGTLGVAGGGTGATTLTGILKGNGTSAFTAATAGTDYVAPGGALGTPSSGTLSSCTVDGTNSVGFLGLPQNTQAGSYTLVLADAGKHIYHASGAGAATYTIPANSSVAYPVGTAVTFVNMSATAISIAITTDSLYLSSAGTTGTRTLAQYGSATALKIASTTWIISGSGLT